MSNTETPVFKQMSRKRIGTALLAFSGGKWLLLCTSLICLFSTTTAYADFRKALDALQNRDGPAMLAEVKDAVAKNNSDGMLLFIDSLYFDGKTIKEASIDLPSNIEDRSKLKFISVIDEEKTTFLFDSLEKFAQNKPYLQFRLAAKRYANNKEIKKTIFKKLAEGGLASSALALYFEFLNEDQANNTSHERAYWIKKAAELGSPYAAYVVGAQYLNKPDFNEVRLDEFPKDEGKAYFWIKKSLVSADSATDPFRNAANQMSYLVRKGVNGIESNAHESFLWEMAACFSPTLLNSGTPNSCLAQNFSLLKMYKKGLLTQNQIEEYGPFWCDAVCEKNQDQTIPSSWQNMTRLELPTLLLNKTINYEEKPIFSLQKIIIRGGIIANFQYRLDIYNDGRVTLLRDPVVPDEKPQETAWQISPMKVNELISNIYKLNFNQWKLANYSEIDTTPNLDSYSLTIRDLRKEKTVLIYEQSNNLDKQLVINKLIALIEKIVPIQNFAGTPLNPTNTQILDSREKNIHTKKGIK